MSLKYCIYTRSQRWGGGMTEHGRGDKSHTEIESEGLRQREFGVRMRTYLLMCARMLLMRACVHRISQRNPLQNDGLRLKAPRCAASAPKCRKPKSRVASFAFNAKGRWCYRWGSCSEIGRERRCGVVMSEVHLRPVFIYIYVSMYIYICR